MDPNRFKITIDPLYGAYKLDSFLGRLVVQPELQRLRDIRLSNINSMLMPGGANISRFEHSVGTAILADRVAKLLYLSEVDKRHLVCAALLHDVAITPFGHLMEEGFRYAGLSYDHEHRLEEIFLGTEEVGNINFQIYRGRSFGFRRVLELKEYRTIGVSASIVFELERGRGALGNLIHGSIDLDNIDNVCRMAHHIGIQFRHKLPLDLLAGFFIFRNELCYNTAQLDCVEEWLALRESLYNLLMTNPPDFAAKTMLLEAIRIALLHTKQSPPHLRESDWKLTDTELIDSLQKFGPTKAIIQRLLVGELFDIVGLFWLDTGLQRTLTGPENVWRLRNALARQLECNSNDIVVYVIPDKRFKLIENLRFTDKLNPRNTLHGPVGKEPTQFLLGITTARKDLANVKNMTACMKYLAQFGGENSVKVCNPLQHIRHAMSMQRRQFLNPL